jgi:hypothetical protein
VKEAWQALDICFERFCLTAGVEVKRPRSSNATSVCANRTHRMNRSIGANIKDPANT